MTATARTTPPAAVASVVAPPGTRRAGRRRRDATGRARHPAALIVSAVALLAALVGCALPTDSHPRAIDTEKLPGVRGADDQVTTTTVGEDAQSVQIYLMKNSVVWPVTRQVNAVTPGALIELLAAGPTKEEQAEGISGSVPPDTKLLSSLITNGVITIDVTEDLLSVGSPKNRAAYAQIVFTLVDEIDEVNAVRVDVEGQSVSIPTGADTGPVDQAGKASFKALDSSRQDAARATTTTTTIGPPPAP